ncbi:MAG: SH3 domain-containing protein [Deltaproteobacteria bacterium]|nr:SH3 domain-containing protein [Deltaproteobacteria bacterium]MBM4347877.1 SH3 domain-containing protein [Deltaproteobacteria bacterium]
MKRFFKNYFFLAFILILTLAFLVGCAKQKVQIQVEEKPTSTAVVKEEPAKPAPEPPKPEPPSVSEPPKKETPPAPPPAKIEPPPPPSAPVAIPPPPTPVQPEIKKPAQRTTEVARSSVNLRKGPSMKGRITRVLKKGTKLIVLEEKEGWLHVRLKDGAEGWIAKSMTTERAQPSPAAPPKGKK